jgi:predicted ATPase
VLGEAGVGKSRLVEEFVRRIAGQAAVLRGRCLSYGDGITFFPLAEVLRRAAGIVPEDNEQDARIKLKSCFGEQLADATSRIESVMGLSQHPYGQDELFWAVRAVLQELARRRPLVVVFDDVHWAEPTFLDLIEGIVDAALNVPLLVVCAARDELRQDRPGFAAGRRAASQIELGELSQEDCGLVVRNFLGEAVLARPLEQRILGLAEGNPLFVEQMLSMLIDDGLLHERAGRWIFSGAAEAVSIPGNILSLLGARLDRLMPSELGIVELASVIGLEFSSDAVSALAGEGDTRIDLGRPLAALCTKQLMSRAEPGAADDFRFTHILVRDTAYARLPKRTRARLHERFAAWLSDTFRARPAEYEEILGYHLEQSFRYRAELGPVDEAGRRLGDQASRYLTSVGRRALAHGDMPAAANLLHRAAALLGERDPARALLLLDAGEEVLTRARDDRKARALAELAIGQLEAMRGDFDRARLLYCRSRASLEESGYLFAAALTSLNSSVIELLADDIAAAESELRKDYRRLEEMGERNYISTTAGLLAEVLYRQGRYEESAEFAGICEHLASPGDVASQFHWRCVRGKLKARQGEIGQAEALLSAATALIEPSDQLDLQGNGLLDFAEIRELSGAPSDAAALSERAAELFERKGNTVSAVKARQLTERLLSQADRAAVGGDQAPRD